jgi:hypothetical protein
MVSEKLLSCRRPRDRFPPEYVRGSPWLVLAAVTIPELGSARKANVSIDRDRNLAKPAKTLHHNIRYIQCRRPQYVEKWKPNFVCRFVAPAPPIDAGFMRKQGSGSNPRWGLGRIGRSRPLNPIGAESVSQGAHALRMLSGIVAVTDENSWRLRGHLYP